jgi:hypothetical protein
VRIHVGMVLQIRCLKIMMMNRLSLLGLLSLCAVSVYSCTKDNNVTAQDEELRPVTLRACEEAGTKVGFDADGIFYWTKGDRIAVTTKSNKTAFAELTLDEKYSGQASGTFTGRASSEPEGYAFYPADRAESMDGDKITFTYASTYAVQKPDQTFFVTPQGTGNSFYAPMWGKIEDGSVIFKHLGGVLCLKVDKMPSTDGKVIVTADQQLYGTYTVDLSGTEPVYETGTDASRNRVVFSFTAAEEGNPGVFYLPLPVGTYSNVTVRVQNADNSSNSQTTLEPLTIARAGLYAQDIVTSYAQSVATIRDFAEEFVKCIPIWEQTVGTVDADGACCTANGTAWKNVHFIPIETPSNNPYGTSGNQYDPKYVDWKLNICGTEYNSAQAWDIAIRSLLDLVTKEGDEGIAAMKTRNQNFTLQDGVSLSAAMPSATEGCKWGPTPWYEYGKLVKYNKVKISTVGLDFVTKVTPIHLARGLVKNNWNTKILGYIGNFQEFGTDSSSQVVLSGYSGLISPMRELYILARVYEYILDNNITENVYTALKDQQFDFDMYHQNEIFE